jgi:hypothetical protein
MAERSHRWDFPWRRDLPRRGESRTVEGNVRSAAQLTRQLRRGRSIDPARLMVVLGDLSHSSHQNIEDDATKARKAIDAICDALKGGRLGPTRKKKVLQLEQAREAADHYIAIRALFDEVEAGTPARDELGRFWPSREKEVRRRVIARLAEQIRVNLPAGCRYGDVKGRPGEEYVATRFVQDYEAAGKPSAANLRRHFRARLLDGRTER